MHGHEKALCVFGLPTRIDVVHQDGKSPDGTVRIKMRDVVGIDPTRSPVSIRKLIVIRNQLSGERFVHARFDLREGRVSQHLADQPAGQILERLSKPCLIGVVVQLISVVAVDIRNQRRHVIDDQP